MRVRRNKADEPLPVRIIRDPWVWAGTGFLVRYADDPSTSAQFYKSLGVTLVIIGVGWSIASRD